MARLSYAQIQGELKSAQLASLPPFNIAILRNVVVEPIEPYLRYQGYRLGLNARCEFSEYDNVFQEAVAGQKGILNDKTDCVLVILKLENLSWPLARGFATLAPYEVEAEKSRLKGLFTSILAGVRKQTPGLVLWSSLETPLHPSLGIVDYQRSAGQIACIEEMNAFLREALHAERGAYLLDMNVCVARVGAGQFYDPRYWHMAKAPYARPALEEISNEIYKYIRPLVGKSKKCLVLDCDNVLWGGTIGEDGMPGIKLGKTYPGSAYHELQQEILNLYHRGVLLALCSKNNDHEVWEVFDKHPDMLLRREHIATAQINWRDKVSNLKQIAADLNLGLDSFVFVDDSPFEVEQVRQYLPQVEVVHLPEGEAVTYRDTLAAGGWFDALTFSAEDRERGAMYHAETSRKELQLQSQDLTSYYASLSMVLEIRLADAFSVPRIAQLTQKTNQFNLTTRRYSDAQIHALREDPSVDVILLRLKDRFGDSGLTGVCIMRYDGERALIDTFLLSCRVLGRGVEDAFLIQCMKRARLKGCTSAIGEYLPTAKNHQVRDFYPQRAFAPVASGNPPFCFELDLTSLTASEPNFFSRIDSEIANP
jgi:FkbH-like protein